MLSYAISLVTCLFFKKSEMNPNVDSGPLLYKTLFLSIAKKLDEQHYRLANSTEIHSPWLKKILKSVLLEFPRMLNSINTRNVDKIK